MGIFSTEPDKPQEEEESTLGQYTLFGGESDKQDTLDQCCPKLRYPTSGWIVRLKPLHVLAIRSGYWGGVHLLGWQLSST